MSETTSVDKLGVSSGKGYGVVARREIGGDIPNQGTAWGANQGEEEVRTGRGLCRKSSFAGAVQFGCGDVITVKASHDWTAVHGVAGRGQRLHGFARCGVGWDRNTELTQNIVHALAHDVDGLARHRVGARRER